MAAILGLATLAPTGNAEPACEAVMAVYVPGAEDYVPILEDHYLRYTQVGTVKYAQLWRETNDIRGLQVNEVRCHGVIYPADLHRYSVPISGTGSLPV